MSSEIEEVSKFSKTMNFLFLNFETKMIILGMCIVYGFMGAMGTSILHPRVEKSKLTSYEVMCKDYDKPISAENGYKIVCYN